MLHYNKATVIEMHQQFVLLIIFFMNLIRQTLKYCEDGVFFNHFSYALQDEPLVLRIT